MSTATRHTEALALQALSRKPRQGRSLASFERMLEATKSLMIETGGDSFTLQDVSERGQVSIGSIYLRFESKDRLLHAVIAEELQAIIAKERVMIDAVLAETSSLGAFLPLYIARYSAFLEEHAPLLRTIMARAEIDPLVSEPGKETARRSAEMSIAAILTFRDEIKSADPEAKALAVFQIVFATIARQFGLGSTPESSDPYLWGFIKDEIVKMALAYLRHAD
ncbi:TetR/AcrR family transcriptional regulator [Novosphingobium sp. NDB2Meth1]|uniref:TetR/AcrR family transcriptional regulator n=1 Tax=Novosphingobium sp. NDB2Meth1 TaxID=1892847 RepID=UPI000931E7B4|nr:TetR/AcrR family transcriptional regulator [Novosphingobium sp. NDB2Meth1]